MTGEQLALGGIRAVRRGADPGWLAAATRQVRWLATVRGEFTTDDVHALLEQVGVHTRDTRALGSVMRSARDAGHIEATGRYVPSGRAECHARPIMVWRGL